MPYNNTDYYEKSYPKNIVDITGKVSARVRQLYYPFSATSKIPITTRIDPDILNALNVSPNKIWEK